MTRIKTTFPQKNFASVGLKTITIGYLLFLGISIFSCHSAKDVKNYTTNAAIEKIANLSKNNILVCAHRSFHTNAPENSLQSIKNAIQAKIDADKTPPVVAEQKNSVQLIKATYTVANDVKPNKFTVKVGSPVQFDIAAQEDGQGCMGSIMIPGLTNQAQGFERGKTTTLAFTPTKPGSYTITCAMGVPKGTIIVE